LYVKYNKYHKQHTTFDLHHEFKRTFYGCQHQGWSQEWLLQEEPASDV